MIAEYWNIPENLKQARDPEFLKLIELMRAKIEYIKYCYSNNLSESQFKRVQQDEELITQYNTYIDLLHRQIEYMCEITVSAFDETVKALHKRNAVINLDLTKAVENYKYYAGQSSKEFRPGSPSSWYTYL